MYRTIAGLLVGVSLLSLSFAKAQNKDTLIPDKPVGLNAEHQSNDEADVAITRKIRQAVVRDKALSFYAQNVKIITVDGHVMLKGAVRNNKEKNTIEQIAADVAGKEQVTSELELVR